MRTRRERLRDLLKLSVTIGIVLFARASLADHYVVPSESMLPTIAVSDRLLVNKLAYGLRVPLSGLYLLRFAGPARGEVVVLTSPEDGKVLVKRVAAVPGDRIEVAGGRLRVNGAPAEVAPCPGEHDTLCEALGARRHRLRLDDGGGPDLGPLRVPEDHYLMLGDNRGNSHDGRAFGLVPRSALLGRAVSVFARGGRLTWQPL
jgi:signal peptidase I